MHKVQTSTKLTVKQSLTYTQILSISDVLICVKTATPGHQPLTKPESSLKFLVYCTRKMADPRAAVTQPSNEISKAKVAEAMTMVLWHPMIQLN